MLEQEKIEDLTNSFRKNLEELNKNGKLDQSRGLSEVIESFTHLGADFQSEAVEAITGVKSKKKVVINAETIIGILEKESLI